MTTFIIFITAVIGGFAESQGYVHASKVWLKGQFVWPEAMKSFLGFAIGTVMLFLAIKFLNELKIFSAELQTIIWFTTTMLGIAFISGRFFSWPLAEKVVSLFVIISIGWLLIRVGK